MEWLKWYEHLRTKGEALSSHPSAEKKIRIYVFIHYHSVIHFFLMYMYFSNSQLVFFFL
jgi:hypothetical protein